MIILKIFHLQAKGGGGHRSAAKRRRNVSANISKVANRTKVETPLAFPSGEGGPLVVDEEIDLPQNTLTP